MLDPNLAIRKAPINYGGSHPYYPWVDMPIFDYILHTEYPGDFVTGHGLRFSTRGPMSTSLTSEAAFRHRFCAPRVAQSRR